MHSRRLIWPAGAAMALAALAISAPASAQVTCTKVANATSGSDTNPGTVAAPYRTIGKLIANLSAGDTGCARGGMTYVEGDVGWQPANTGTASAPVTLTTYPGDARATLQLRLSIKDGADYVTVTDVNLDARTSSLPSPTLRGDHALFDDVDVTSNGTAQICFNLGLNPDTANYNVIRNSRIHNCGDPNDDQSTVHHHGIYVGSGTGNQVLDNFIYDNAGRGIQFYPDAHDSVVTGNVIDGNNQGVDFSGDVFYPDNSPPVSLVSTGNRVERNIVTNSLRENIYSLWLDGGVVDANAPKGWANVANDNCVWNAGTSNVNTVAGGFNPSRNRVADPLYVNRAAKNFALQAGSPCDGELVNPWWELLSPNATIGSAPSAASYKPRRLDVFATSATGVLQHKWFDDGAGWFAFETLGQGGPSGNQPYTSAPAAISPCMQGRCTNEQIDVFARGSDNTLQHKRFNGTSWQAGSKSLGGVLASAPAVASRATTRLDVFWRASDNTVRQLYTSNNGTSWAPITNLGGAIVSAPAAVSWSGDNNRLDVFGRGVNNDLQWRWWTPSTGWSAWTSLGGNAPVTQADPRPSPGGLTSAPAATGWETSTGAHRLDVFVRGADGAMWTKTYTTAGGWNDWRAANSSGSPTARLGGQLADAPGAVAWDVGRIDTFSEGDDSRLWHMWYDGSWHPSP